MSHESATHDVFLFFTIVIVQTEFRFYWLQTKLQEEPLVAQVSTENPVSRLIINRSFVLHNYVVVPVADPDLELRGARSLFTCHGGHFPFSHFFFFYPKQGGGGWAPQAPPLDLPLGYIVFNFTVGFSLTQCPFFSTGLSVCLIVPVMTAPFIKLCPVLLQLLRYMLITHVGTTTDE